MLELHLFWVEINFVPSKILYYSNNLCNEILNVPKLYMYIHIILLFISYGIVFGQFLHKLVVEFYLYTLKPIGSESW